jgi:hypothetical protein
MPFPPSIALPIPKLMTRLSILATEHCNSPSRVLGLITMPDNKSDANINMQEQSDDCDLEKDNSILAVAITSYTIPLRLKMP